MANPHGPSSGRAGLRNLLQGLSAQVQRVFLAHVLAQHEKASELHDQNTAPYLDYWKSRLEDFALVHLTTELIGKERRVLVDTPTSKGEKRNPATVNRYVSSLSALLSHAARLKWISENPCFNLNKLKESSGRDRVMTEDEISRLLVSCRESKSLYLYCIILLSLTTGARQGEILNL